MCIPRRSIVPVMLAVTAGTAIMGCAEPAGTLLPPPAAHSASSQPGGDAAQAQLLATIRQSTARYHRVEAALADGYVLGSPCEAIASGGIGVHYRKSALIDVVVDPSQPELLVYEPRKNGDLQLVAVAFVIRAAPWDLVSANPPMLGVQPFEDKRVPDWSSPPFPTYELHVWVWKHNPNGMYATTNPTVSCEYATTR